MLDDILALSQAFFPSDRKSKRYHAIMSHTNTFERTLFSVLLFIQTTVLPSFNFANAVFQRFLQLPGRKISGYVSGSPERLSFVAQSNRISS